MTGVDVKQQSADHNTQVAAGLGIEADFVVGSIGEARLDRAPDVVLALHACDTATDDALARAVEWQASLVLAAPCCHHDIASQLRTAEAPAPYAMLTRHGILRERFADTLTDALRASLLRREGYRVDVVRVRRERPHPAQHPAPRGAHGRARRRGASRSTTSCSPRGAYVPGSASCSAAGSAGEERRGAHQGLPQAVGQRDADQQPRQGDEDGTGGGALRGAHRVASWRSATRSSCAAWASASKWDSATGRIIRLAMKPTASTPTMVSSAGR